MEFDIKECRFKLKNGNLCKKQPFYNVELLLCYRRACYLHINEYNKIFRRLEYKENIIKEDIKFKKIKNVY